MSQIFFCIKKVFQVITLLISLFFPDLKFCLCFAFTNELLFFY